MKYLVSILRIFVLVAVVLAIANFSDIKKAKAASNCSATECYILEDGFINSGAIPTFHGSTTTLALRNKAIFIKGPIIVTTHGSLTFFSDLTITDGATVTQEAIDTSDIVADKTLNSTGLNKKVDLNVTGTLSLTNQGRIDVSGKGFPGGTGSHLVGYGPGGGCADDGSNTYTGGGGAYGGSSTSLGCIGGIAPSAYGDKEAPDKNGSGGGYNRFSSTNGSSGGGIIKINANKMILDQNDQIFISADGTNGVNRSPGGAGGSVWIAVQDLDVGYPSSGSPSAVAGDHFAGCIGCTSSYGTNGTVIPSSGLTFGKYITAKGSTLSSGGGGRIKIAVTKITPSCRITGGDQIPAACEGKDVTVSGTTINMNKVKVKEDGSSCSNSADSTCDSKRYFKSLTVGSGGVITYEALTYAEIETGGKTVNRSAGTGRWKKVDIDVGTGTITLKSGGKIDVTGKGYPGAYFSRDEINGSGDQGCNGVTMGYLVGANHISGTGWTSVTDYGFGPGGGIAYRQKNNSTGGGGSFGGQGKAGTGETILLTGLKTYNYLAGTYLEWGSGGGAASHYGGDTGGEPDVTCTNGGAGGGIIDLKANILDMTSAGGSDATNGYWILADGAQGLLIPPDDSNLVGSGGGSGGVIRLNFNQILKNTMGALNGTSIYAGINQYSGDINIDNGKIVDPPSLPTWQISARGGARSEHNVPSYGAGGGGGWIVFGAGPTPTLTATLSASGTFKTGDPTTLTAAPTPDSTATGTINYTFWWNCTNSSTIVSIVSADPACGIPTVESAGSFGAKFDGITDNPKTVQHTYITGSYTAKVIIERNGVSATITTPITVTGPTIKSKKIEVTVTWKEGTQNKTVKLYDVLRSVVTVP